MSSRCLDRRLGLACALLGCALGALLTARGLATGIGGFGGFGERTAAERTIEPSASDHVDSDLSRDPHAGYVARPADGPPGFIPLVWKKGIDPQPLTVAVALRMRVHPPRLRA